MKNNKGFVNTLLILSMPVLLTLIFASMGYNFSQKTQSESKHICRKELLSTQADVVPILHLLLHVYKPQAIALEIQFYTTTIKWIAAIASNNYPLAAQLLVEIHNIYQKQKQIDKTQSNYIKMANGILKISTIKAQAQIIASLYKNANQKNNFFSITQWPDKLTIPELPVEKVTNTVGAPYKLKKNFSDKQAITVRWIWTWSVHFPWEEQDRKMQLFVLKDGCSATLEEDKLTWIPNLKKVKSLPNF